jgi:Uma2 family endonuclease
MHSGNASRPSPIGPHRADEIRSGDPYELSNGYLVECMPTGQRGGRSSVAGTLVLDTDPAVESSGIDTGFSPHPAMLRAPDLSIGNVEDKPGWGRTVPPLAVEYADTGQDEVELQKKIVEFLAEGTQFLWVVRLTGPRRVEVYEPGTAMRVVWPGEVLKAPGILRNEVPVEVLYDREKAHRATLRNLLQREGYDSVEAVKAAGRDEGLKTGFKTGRDEGRLVEARSALRRVLARRELTLDAADEARIEACIDLATLERWHDEAVVASSAADALR